MDHQVLQEHQVFQDTMEFLDYQVQMAFMDNEEWRVIEEKKVNYTFNLK